MCITVYKFVYYITINISSGITSSKHNPDVAEKLKDVFVTASGTSFYEQCSLMTPYHWFVAVQLYIILVEG